MVSRFDCLIPAVFAVRRALRAAGREAGICAFRCVTAVGIVAVSVSLSGCYSYIPVQISDARANHVVAAEISDIGRVALAQQAGAEVARVEGQLTENSDSALRITVAEVRYLNGIANKWQGQDVVLRPQDVKVISERTLSRGRTAAAVAFMGGLVLAAIFNKNFIGIFSGDPNRDKPPEPPPVS